MYGGPKPSNGGPYSRNDSLSGKGSVDRLYQARYTCILTLFCVKIAKNEPSAIEMRANPDTSTYRHLVPRQLAQMNWRTNGDIVELSRPPALHFPTSGRAAVLQGPADDILDRRAIRREKQTSTRETTTTYPGQSWFGILLLTRARASPAD